MPVIESNLSPSGDAFRTNRDAMLAVLDRIRGIEERTRRASAASKERFEKRGQLLPRERLSLLLDHGAPFLELSTLAGYCLDNPDPEKSVPGGGVVAGIGYVAGTRCMVIASDSGIDAGALQPRGLDKQLRIQEALTLSQEMDLTPGWVDVDAKKMAGTFKAAPDRADLPSDINENLIVELYSK